MNPDYPESRTVGLKKERKLSVSDVDEIRDAYRYHSRDANCRALAERFGVSPTTIHNIVREKKWLFDDWSFRSRSTERESVNFRPYVQQFQALEKTIQMLRKLDRENPEIEAIYQRYKKHAASVK